MIQCIEHTWFLIFSVGVGDTNCRLSETVNHCAGPFQAKIGRLSELSVIQVSDNRGTTVTCFLAVVPRVGMLLLFR